MATNITEVRFTGTTKDLREWEDFLRAIESKELITIYEITRLYPNRDSELKRQFYKLKFNGNIDS